VLFKQRFYGGLVSGAITVTIRKWSRAQVKVGGRYRTPACTLAVDAIEHIPIERVTEADARAAGFADLAALCRETGLEAGDVIYRVHFHRVDDAPAPVHSDDVIRTRLERLDRASKTGPWTRAVLDLIATRPGTRAADLAGLVGREKLPFKADERKLKALGLTESLEVGYRLSPRGQAFVAGEAPARES
jgi:hypothetical protein